MPKVVNVTPIQTVSGDLAMQETVRFECELCLENYNLYDKKPYSLVPCGHSICIKCFESLTKTVCPYCRAPYATKIPNWEIIKRLPKPSVPIIYFQVEIKLKTLRNTSTDFEKYVTEYNSESKDSLAKLREREYEVETDPKISVTPLTIVTADNELNKKAKTSIAKNAPATTQQKKVNTPKSQFMDKLDSLDKKLSTYNQNNNEINFNLKKKCEKFWAELSQDENKFNEDNLKRIKKNIETVNKTMLEKLSSLRKEREKLKILFSSENSSKNHEELKSYNLDLLNQIDAILEHEGRCDNQTLQQLNSLLASNVIRPISNATNEANDANIDHMETLRCTGSQKGKKN